MCNFSLQTEKKRISCPYYSTGNEDSHLPIDQSGLCIYHSRDSDWKIANDFNAHLSKIMESSSKLARNKTLLLETIVFTDSVEPLFAGTEFQNPVSFDYATFKSKANFTKTKFTNGVKFRFANFEKSVAFKEVDTQGFDMQGAIIKGILTLADFNSSSYLDAEGITTFGLRVENARFAHFTSFNKVSVKQRSAISYCKFTNVDFESNTTFDHAVFDCFVLFEDINVRDSLSFYGTQFNYALSQPNYAAVNFINTTVLERGNLDFKGSAEHKLFSGAFSARFLDEDIKGKLAFEHVDFNKFDKDTKNRLVANSKGKDAKILIGVGCLKYFNQTPVKKIRASTENQNLVTELCNTFSEYFAKSMGYNLGVEIVSRTDQEIALYYYSDENIPYETFEAQLQSSEAAMWRLVKIKNQSVQSNQEPQNLPSKIINATDTIINLLGTILKIATRIPMGMISPSEVANVLSTTNFSSQSSVVLDSITTLNVNQTILLGIGNTQRTQISANESDTSK